MLRKTTIHTTTPATQTLTRSPSSTSANSSRSLDNYKAIAAGGAPSGSGGYGGGSGSPGSQTSAGSPGSTTAPAGSATSAPTTGGAAIASVSSSLLIALGAAFMLL